MKNRVRHRARTLSLIVSSGNSFHGQSKKEAEPRKVRLRYAKLKTMFSYELAVKLKEAGFPQYGNGQLAPTPQGLTEKDIAYIPTLSELIEACDGKWGQRFRWLGNEKTHWSAQARPMHPKSNKYPDSPIDSWKGNKDVKAIGKTPEEAVARLYLALQK